VVCGGVAKPLRRYSGQCRGAEGEEVRYQQIMMLHLGVVHRHEYHHNQSGDARRLDGPDQNLRVQTRDYKVMEMMSCGLDHRIGVRYNRIRHGSQIGCCHVMAPSVSSPRRSRYRYPVNCYSRAGGISSYGDMLAIAWIQALSGCISVCGGRLSDRESGLVN
jgi:hypothetical protein